MQENRNRRLRRHHHYINKKQPQFEVTSYLDNPHMIQGLHEHRMDAMEWAKHVEEQLDLAEEQIERLQECTHNLELEKLRFEIDLAGATSRAEVLDSEKNKAQAEVKSLINQLAEAKAANHEILLQNTAFDLKLKNAQSKLEMQDIEVKDMLTRYYDLEDLVENLRSANHQMELENQELEIELNMANQRLDEVSGKWRTFPQYVVTIVATAILSFGTSMIASSPSSSSGWGLVIAGGSLEIIAFVITLTSRPKKIARLQRTARLQRITGLQRTASSETDDKLEKVTEPERTAENG